MLWQDTSSSMKPVTMLGVNFLLQIRATPLRCKIVITKSLLSPLVRATCFGAGVFPALELLRSCKILSTAYLCYIKKNKYEYRYCNTCCILFQLGKPSTSPHRVQARDMAEEWKIERVLIKLHRLQRMNIYNTYVNPPNDKLRHYSTSHRRDVINV